jgi:hypothetical protein
MDVNGRCHCGDVQFEASVNPKRVGICHCADCQIFSSSAFRTSVLVPGVDFRLLTGQLTRYEKTSESGALRALLFCGRCGTHICGTSENAEGALYSLRVGVLAERDELPPVVQVWCQSEVPWLSRLAEIRRIDRQ